MEVLRGAVCSEREAAGTGGTASSRPGHARPDPSLRPGASLGPNPHLTSGSRGGRGSVCVGGTQPWGLLPCRPGPYPGLTWSRPPRPDPWPVWDWRRVCVCSVGGGGVGVGETHALPFQRAECHDFWHRRELGKEGRSDLSRGRESLEQGRSCGPPAGPKGGEQVGRTREGRLRP